MRQDVESNLDHFEAMAKKRKDPKSITFQEDNGTNDLLSKEDQNQFGTGKNTTTHHSAPPSNHHFQPVVQWPYTTQSDAEQSSSFSKSSIQWHQSQPQQPNPIIHQAQHQPIWMAPHPGYHFSPVGTTDVTWQGPGITSGGTSSRNQSQTSSSFLYPPSFPYPGFPGSWDPSSWWGHPQQSLHSCTYTFPGAGGFFPSLPPPIPSCSAALAPFLQRGTIQPPEKLSRKHQQLWEAQSAENVQLWNVVRQLQSELADYKNRLTKLESTILLPKPTVEESANRCTLASSNGQKSKRGRPKRPIAPNNVLPSSDDSRPRARGLKTALHNCQTDSKDLKFQQEGQTMEAKATNHHTSDRNTDIVFANCNDNTQIAGGSPLFQDIPIAEIRGVGQKIFSELKAEESKFKGIESKSASPTYVGMTSNGNFVWPANIFTKDMGRETFYNDVNLSGHARKLVTGWSFANEEDASIGIESAAEESGKDEDEMEDDGSSGAEETA